MKYVRPSGSTPLSTLAGGRWNNGSGSHRALCFPLPALTWCVLRAQPKACEATIFFCCQGAPYVRASSIKDFNACVCHKFGFLGSRFWDYFLMPGPSLASVGAG